MGSHITVPIEIKRFLEEPIFSKFVAASQSLMSIYSAQQVPHTQGSWSGTDLLATPLTNKPKSKSQAFEYWVLVKECGDRDEGNWGTAEHSNLFCSAIFEKVTLINKSAERCVVGFYATLVQSKDGSTVVAIEKTSHSDYFSLNGRTTPLAPPASRLFREMFTAHNLTTIYAEITW